ncbi:guanine nucleotide-binding protein subunit beta-like protein 1 [Halichondria panicea]|uniref:guanine nucleotide-binding protein subunit beta-like protein 1 n=1 Tax=Halichondria panicea TaxID=6063 RepID=UPI00312B52C8
MSDDSIPCPPDPLYTLRPRAGEVTDLQFVTFSSASSGYLITGTTFGRIGLWDLSSKRELWYQDCDNPILSVNSLPTNNYLLSQLRSNVVTAWDLEKECQLSSMSIDRTGFCKLAVLAEGAIQSNLSMDCFVVAHFERGKVNVYDYKTQSCMTTLSVETPGDRGMCMCVCMYNEESTGVTYVFGGFEDGSIVLWDTRQCQKELASIKLFLEPVMCMAMDSEKSSIVAGSATNIVEKVYFSKDKIQKKFSVEIKNPGVASLAVRNGGKIFCTGGWDGRIRIFGSKKGKHLAVLNYHSSTVNTCYFIQTSAQSVNSNLIVCGSKDERVSIWKIY